MLLDLQVSLAQLEPKALLEPLDLRVLPELQDRRAQSEQLAQPVHKVFKASKD